MLLIIRLVAVTSSGREGKQLHKEKQIKKNKIILRVTLFIFLTPFSTR